MILLIIIFPAPSYAQSTDQGEQSTLLDSVEIIQEGFSGSTSSDIDYEALVKELYGSENSKEPISTANPSPEKIVKKEQLIGPAPGLLKNGFLHGAHVALNVSSPFAVSDPLLSWYSFIDGGITMKIPYELDVESIPLFILFEISSFNFTNSYPEGGSFRGISYIMQVSSIGDRAGVALGFGFWDRQMGSMLEMNYRFRPTRNTFFRLGTRGVMITDIDPVGAAWWLELRLSAGIEL